jgi:hypothetical protein
LRPIDPNFTPECDNLRHFHAGFDKLIRQSGCISPMVTRWHGLPCPDQEDEQMKKIAMMAGAAAALLAGAALAQPGGPGGKRGGPDANGDGIVTRAEVEADVAKRFGQMDMNDDGKIDQADREGRAAATAGKPGRGGAMLDRLDTNGDGAVSLDEMKQMTMARFDRADANKDGKLTGDEREAMRPRRGGPGGAPPMPAE